MRHLSYFLIKSMLWEAKEKKIKTNPIESN